MKDEKPGNKPETTDHQAQPVPTATPATKGRRRLLKQLAAGGGIIAGSGALPDRWGRPLVQSVVLPAHGITTPPPTTPTPTPALNQCGDGVDETFGSGCGGSVTWTLDNFDPAGICNNVTAVCDDCPGNCAISTNSQVLLQGTGFTPGTVLTAAWDSSQNPPEVTVAGDGTFQINAGNISQGCDILRLIEDPDGAATILCSETFCGVPTGPCDPFTP